MSGRTVIGSFGELYRAGVALDLPLDVMNAIETCPSHPPDGTFGGKRLGVGAFDCLPFENIMRRHFIQPNKGSLHDRMVAQIVAMRLTK